MCYTFKSQFKKKIMPIMKSLIKCREEFSCTNFFYDTPFSIDEFLHIYFDGSHYAIVHYGWPAFFIENKSKNREQNREYYKKHEQFIECFWVFSLYGYDDPSSDFEGEYRVSRYKDCFYRIPKIVSGMFMQRTKKFFESLPISHSFLVFETIFYEWARL